MRQKLFWGWLALVFVVGSSPTFADPSLTYGEANLRRQAEFIKPTAAEVRFQQIPWELDLHEAIRLAKKEQRPLFFWAAGGRERDGVPLERC
jgi:hypothetical protein